MTVLLVCLRLHRLVDAVKGGKLSYTALAMEREQNAYSSLLTLSLRGGPGRP